MREGLRGALLSVLFFALMIGGAPAMAAADQPTSVASAHMSPGSCGDAGGSWINKSRPGNPNGYCTFDDLTWDEMVGTDPWCDLMRKGQTAGAIDAAVIGFIFGGPIGGIGAGLFVGGLVEIYISYHC